jgi:2-haloacid dehalogenase
MGKKPSTTKYAAGTNTSRRRFIALAAGAAAFPAAVTLGSGTSQAATRIRAVAFDAFPIFDPRAVFTTAVELVPQRGEDLRLLWFQKLFAYTWLRTTAGRYASFDDVVAESLDYAAGAIGVDLDRRKRDRLVGAFWNLPVWPDVTDQLRRLHARGVRLAFLSNMSEAMLTANMRHNGIEPFFDSVLSTDRVRAFKPAPEAYALGVRELGLTRDEIAFAAFAAWDAAGASWFGYPTAWVNRLMQPPETVGAPAARTGRDLTVVSALIDQSA